VSARLGPERLLGDVGLLALWVGSCAFERKPYFLWRETKRETRPECARADNRFTDAWMPVFVDIWERYDTATGVAWDVDDVTVSSLASKEQRRGVFALRRR